MGSVVTISGAVGTMPLPLWNWAWDWDETGDVKGTITIIAQQNLSPGFLSHARATSVVEAVKAFVIEWLARVAPLLAHGKKGGVGDVMVGLDEAVADDDGWGDVDGERGGLESHDASVGGPRHGPSGQCGGREGMVG